MKEENNKKQKNKQKTTKEVYSSLPYLFLHLSD
jgi:hypothetical protein